MSSNFFEEDIGSLLLTALEELTGTVRFVNPTRAAVPALVSRLDEVSSRPTVRLLSAEEPLKTETEDFLIASTAADLVESGALSIRTLREPPESSLLISDSMVVSLVSNPERVAGLTATEPGFVGSVRDYYDDRWVEAPEYSLRTPGFSHVRETLATEIGPEATEDFDAFVGSLPSLRGDGEGFDEVAVCLLVAAKNGVLLYDISKWGEDVGLASKATFSRTKNVLEDEGLIETEKVPIDVGRPRLRLMLGDERMREADAAQLATIAREKLAE